MPPLNRSLIPASAVDADRETFDYRKADDFYQKSLSEHTRDAYRRVIREFFTVHREAHPAEITPKQALAWRDSLVKKKQKPHTVAFKLSVVRSFYEYLRAAGIVTLMRWAVTSLAHLADQRWNLSLILNVADETKTDPNRVLISISAQFL